MAQGEPVTLTNEDKLYLKSIRVIPYETMHSDLLRDSLDHTVYLSSIYGHFWYGGITKQGIDYLRNNYNTQPNDVFVTSFPRSGTHWYL